MRPRPAFPSPQRSLAWLCCLGLLLALAQSVAAWHGLSHAASRVVAGAASGGVAGDAGDEADPPAPHAALCQLCLAGAAVGGAGALPAAVPLPTVPAWRHPAPEFVHESVWLAGPPSAYTSRGPPIAPG